MVRVGRYGPYLSHGESRTGVPDDLPPDELTVEKAVDLLGAPADDRPLGTDASTGLVVSVRKGRFGPYVQLGEDDEAGGKPKRASLFKDMDPATLRLEEALELLALPRVLGEVDGEEVLAQNGRYGPFIKQGKETRSLASEADLLTVSLPEALALLAEPKRRRGQGAPKPPLRELGDDPVSGKPIVMKEGRFGPYVTDGETNASLRRGDVVEEVTPQRAAELLQERRDKEAAGLVGQQAVTGAGSFERELGGSHSPRAFSTFDGSGIAGPAWVFWLPPLWFLGVYETVAGSASAQLQEFARIGWSALALAVGVLLVAGPIAGARTLRGAFAVSALARWPAGRWLADQLACLLTRRPAARGAIAFTLATLARVSAPRLVFALLSAVGLTGLVPVIGAAISLRPDATMAVLAFPFVMQFFALLGLRLAIRTPVELPGRWLFDQTDVSPLAGRRGRVERSSSSVVWSSRCVATAVLWLWLWEPAVAVARIVAALAGGWLALEVLMWGYVGVPCSRPLVSAAFRGRTLALVVGFEVFCFESAAAQAGWKNEIGPVLWQAIFFAVTAAGVHIGSERSAAVNAIVDEHLDPRLDLEVVGPLEHGRRVRQVRRVRGTSYVRHLPRSRLRSERVSE